MTVDKRKILHLVLLAFLVVGFLEITLSLLALVSPRTNEILTSYAAPRERFDSKGFRNPKVPSKADIIALGDSQTYGVGVAAEDAWPRQLESMTGKTVYSMALGGYGPVHSLILWDEAVALHPKVVIEAFYAGNDLFDSFNLVYNGGQHPELKTADLQLQKTIQAVEQSDPIGNRVARIFQMQDANVSVVGVIGFIRQLLSQRSKLYGLLRRTKSEFERFIEASSPSHQDDWESAKAFAKAHQKYCQVFSNGQWRTVFTSEYRFSALNLEDPRIAEGLQVSLRVLKRLNEQATATNIRFVVVLIPTKETVFRELWQDAPISFRTLSDSEQLFWAATKEFLEQNGIEFLDTLPALRDQLTTGIQPYPVSNDGHPNELGHRAIAKLVAAYLE